MNTTVPVISGTAQQGDTLSVSSGVWTGSPTQFRYAWLDCDGNGLNCVAIGGEGASSYTVQAGDVGDTIEASVTATNAGGSATATTVATPVVTTGMPPVTSQFPLKVSANGRYLETAQGNPWLMVGDSPQSAVGNLSTANWASFVDDRASMGFNTLWFNAPCSAYTFCNSDGEAYDDNTSSIDIKPFTSGTSPANYDITTPNSAYFAKAVAFASYAETKGIEIMLDPMDTSNCSTGFWQTLTNGGNGEANTSNPTYAYGQFIGTTFADSPNVMFLLGNDFSCYSTDSASDADLYELALGIRDTDPDALQTLEIGIGGYDNEGWSSLDDTTDDWASALDMNGFYTYAPAYAIGRHAYGQASTGPTMLLESNYEFEKNGDTDGCGSNEGDDTARNCRLQEWWTMTSGATGQLYGSNLSDDIDNSTNQGELDSTGAEQIKAQGEFLNTIDWWTLQPDTGSNIVTAASSGEGNGTDCPTTGSIVSVTCITTSSDYDGSSGSATVSLTYLPDPSSFESPVVNLNAFAGTVTATWVDPTDGTETEIGRFSNTGTHTFTPSTNNDAGDKDWVLLLQT